MMIGSKAAARYKSCIMPLLLLLIAMFSIYYPALSPLIEDVVIPNTGAFGSPVAASGSPTDIQAAVDAVYDAGGGTVYVPAGTFYWNGETVTVPGGVNLIGASLAGCMGHEDNWKHYQASTILHNNARQPAPTMIVLDGTNGRQSRISGLQIEINDPPHGVESTSGGSVGIVTKEAKNFRIDHCNVFNFNGAQIQVWAGPRQWTWEEGHSSYGVVDHCFFDAPYKDNGDMWFVAYGVGGIGNMLPPTSSHPEWEGNWDYSSISEYAGKYQDFTDVALVYVEDCNFRRMRHATDGNAGAVLVTRYCLYDHLADENWDSDGSLWNCGEVCQHPNWASQYPPKLTEAYYNRFVNVGTKGDPIPYPPSPTNPGNMHRECPIHPNQPHSMFAMVLRGSSGIYYGSDYYSPEPAPNSWGVLLQLRFEGISGPIGDVHDTYVWDIGPNRYTNVWATGDSNGDGVPDGALSIGPGVQLNVNYFLRQPNHAQDGWDYTPYTYPHPLVQD